MLFNCYLDLAYFLPSILPSYFYALPKNKPGFPRLHATLKACGQAFDPLPARFHPHWPAPRHDRRAPALVGFARPGLHYTKFFAGNGTTHGARNEQ
jgi:hypothetical protein